MQIWHRITFSRKDNVEDIIQTLKIKHKKNLLPGGAYVLHVDISESDKAWPQVNRILQEKNALDMVSTKHTTSEILSAPWVRLMPVFEQCYPQPEIGWDQITYENKCPHCGAGYRQKNPFHLTAEPELGKNDFLCLYWTYTLFCVRDILEEFKNSKIKGYEVLPAINDCTGENSKIISQLVFPIVAKPALNNEDKIGIETCSKCGITKYAYHKRGYMRLKHESLQKDIDCQLTFEWFGSGGNMGFREYIISHRLAKLIIDKGWRGVSLKPIKLI